LYVISGSKVTATCTAAVAVSATNTTIDFYLTRIKLNSDGSYLEQVANLQCAQANSPSYPSWDGK